MMARAVLCVLAIAGAAEIHAANTYAIAAGNPGPAEAFRAEAGSLPASSLLLAEEPSLALEIQALKKANSEPGSKRLEIGLGRALPKAAGQQSTGFQWTAISGGTAAHVRITSAGAQALRVGLEASSLPSGTEIRFTGDGSRTVYGPFIPREVLSGGPIYWSPVLAGPTATMEVFIPEGKSAADAVLSIGRISHLFASPSSADPERDAKNSLPCEVDLICRSASDAALAIIGKAVARMTFTVSSGNTALCTGTLINPKRGPLIPFFFTAAHCVGTRDVASTITTHWFYDRASCGSGGLSSSYVQVAGGARMVYSNLASDALLLELTNHPPAGAVYAGWDERRLDIGTAITGVHHPQGDFKKVSLGTVSGFAANGGAATPADHIVALWNSTTTGVTEPGSSGSGLFTSVGQPATEYRLRGALHGGSSSCSAGADLRDYYSRFDQVYPSIAHLLNPTSVPMTCPFMFLRSDGSVWRWNGNRYGEIGDGTYTNRRVPVRTKVPAMLDIACGPGTSAIATARDGTVWSWGDNGRGQLGDPAATATRETPARVPGLSGIVRVTAGNVHGLALKGDGTVWAWGFNLNGQVGDGTQSTRLSPVQVPLLSGVSAISAGGLGSGAVRDDGSVWLWGSYPALEGMPRTVTIGGSAVPVAVPGISDALDVAVNGFNVLVLGRDGLVRSWGVGNLIGDGTTGVQRTTPYVLPLSNVRAIAMDSNRAAALRADGTVWAWGLREQGLRDDDVRGHVAARAGHRRIRILVGRSRARWLEDVGDRRIPRHPGISNPVPSLIKSGTGYVRRDIRLARSELPLDGKEGQLQQAIATR